MYETLIKKLFMTEDISTARDNSDADTMDYGKLISRLYKTKFEAGRGAEVQSVTVKSTGCGFDSHSRR